MSTDDLETGIAALEKIYPRLSIPLPGDAPFGLKLTSTTTGPLSAHQIRLRGVSFDNSSDLSDVLLVGHRLGGEVGIASGRNEIVTAAPFLFPRETITAQWENADLATIDLDLAAVEDYAQQLAGSENFRLEFRGDNPFDSSTTRQWVDVVNHLYQDVLPNDEAMQVPLIRSEAFRSVARALLQCFPSTFLEQPGPADGGQAVPAAVRRAVEFIDTHGEADIGLVEIAAAARMSPRGLVAAFRRHRGTTPGEYLRRVRMDAVHQELLEQAPSSAAEKVEETALRWGFVDQQSFARRYRESFGEAPADTLHR